MTASWLALWLPRLPTDRLRRAAQALSERPLALYAKTGAAFTLTAIDAHAAEAGLHAGMALADARAMRPDLDAREADFDADARLLDSIAAWCERFTPIAVCDAPDTLFLDITGCAHLFGGEAGLRETLRTRLKAHGFANRAAIAPNPAAAWALARFSRQIIATPETLREALAPLPIAALRLEESAHTLLRSLGLKTIGQIIDAPRAPFAARAGQHAMRRLDLALSRAVEALAPRRPPPPAYALRRLLEPILTLDAILIATQALCADLAADLDKRGLGARRLRLILFGVDGAAREIDMGLTKPERAPAAMQRLLRERLSAAAERFDAEFGFEALRLDAVETAPITLHAVDLAAIPGCDPAAQARLLDTLAARLGPKRVRQIRLRAAHAPERATAWGEGEGLNVASPADGVMRRPLTLFANPQAIEALAMVPDGPPRRFRWRRVLREVARAEGPERIEANWLDRPGAPARDYYRVEDSEGRRYWLYREGLYDAPDPPRWFVHGLFA